MRNLLFVAIGCLSGCVLIVTQAPSESAAPTVTQVKLSLHQVLTQTPPPPRPHATPATVVIEQPLPVPPAALPATPPPARPGCPLFILPAKAPLPTQVDPTDPKLQSKEDMENALVAYGQALEKYIETERSKLTTAYRAYLIKCEALNIKN